jgi:hypothetical protein
MLTLKGHDFSRAIKLSKSFGFSRWGMVFREPRLHAMSFSASYLATEGSPSRSLDICRKLSNELQRSVISAPSLQ